LAFERLDELDHEVLVAAGGGMDVEVRIAPPIEALVASHAGDEGGALAGAQPAREVHRAHARGAQMGEQVLVVAPEFAAVDVLRGQKQPLQAHHQTAQFVEPALHVGLELGEAGVEAQALRGLALQRGVVPVGQAGDAADHQHQGGGDEWHPHRLAQSCQRVGRGAGALRNGG
jgi:hypothetical protein